MENQKESIICVTGRAQESVVPDIARLNVTIQSVNINYLHLYQLAQDNLVKLGKIAEELNLGKDSFKSKEFSIADNNRVEDGDLIKEGYKLTQRLMIELGRDNEKTSTIIYRIGADIPDVQVSISFAVKNARDTWLRLMTTAVEDATEKATIMATAAGCHLAGIKCIEKEGSSGGMRNLGDYIFGGRDEIVCCEMSLKPFDLDNNACSILEFQPQEIELEYRVKVSWYLSPIIK